MAQISFWCSKDLEKLIRRLAKSKELSVSAFVRMQVAESLRDRLP